MFLNRVINVSAWRERKVPQSTKESGAVKSTKEENHMKTYTAEEWKEIQRRNFIAWAKKLGVDLESGKFTYEDGLRLAYRAAAERHWILKHGCDEEPPTEMDEHEVDDYDLELLLVADKVEELLDEFGYTCFELFLLMQQLDEYGHFIEDRIELEGCEEEIEYAAAGDEEWCMVEYE